MIAWDPDRMLYTLGNLRGEPVDRNWLNQYPPGVPADIDPDAYPSLKELIEEAFTHYRRLPAFTNMGVDLTYAQLDELTRAFGAWLQHKSGLVRGDRVALMMPNILQYPVALFGALRAGMVVVNTNPLYTPRELEHQLKDSGAKCIVIVENFAHVLQQVANRSFFSITRIQDGVEHSQRPAAITRRNGIGQFVERPLFGCEDQRLDVAKRDALFVANEKDQLLQFVGYHHHVAPERVHQLPRRIVIQFHILGSGSLHRPFHRVAFIHAGKLKNRAIFA